MPLVTTATERGRRQVCRACSGHAVTYGGLRRTTDSKALAALWRVAADPARRRHLACPSCSNRMTVVPLGTVEAPLHVDVCRACHMIWFDSGEEAQIPAAPSSEAALPAEVHAALTEWRKAEALLEVQRLQRDHVHRAPPSNVVLRVMGYLGLPVEENAPPLQRLPLATWLLARSSSHSACAKTASW
jgi:Zn-finger nucleic acid-binding protein